MTYKVTDPNPDEPETTGLSLPDAIRAAQAAGGDVYVHADDCIAADEIGPDCPCRPAKIPARHRPSTLRPIRSDFRW